MHNIILFYYISYYGHHRRSSINFSYFTSLRSYKICYGGFSRKTGVESALTQQTIKADSLSTSAVGASNFTHIIWFTVQDWNYNYGTFKPLMVRAPATAGASELVPGLNAKSVCPAVILGSQNNNLEVWQTIQDDGNPITPDPAHMSLITYATTSAQ